jgi:hypothetical protein
LPTGHADEYPTLMADWRSANHLSRKYLVSGERLLAYARRGNLPMLSDADGGLLYDEHFVQLLFRPRSAVPSQPGANLGVLGQSRLWQSAGHVEVGVEPRAGRAVQGLRATGT